MPPRPDNAPGWWAAAAVLCLPALLFPVYNPDLFWHLASGRWIVDNGALPRTDPFSFSAPGRPWEDFEWLSQLLFHGVWSAGGFAGLWALKALLLGAGWVPLDAALRLQGLPSAARAAALALWSAGTLGHSDLRPELFSLLFFALVLLALEAGRAGRFALGPRTWAGGAALFALWASLHAGFFMGLGLIAAYGGCALLRGRWREAGRHAGAGAAAVLGTLANPYGGGPYRVAWEHWGQRGELSRYIAEWGPLALRNPLHWPLAALLTLLLALSAALAAAAGPRWRRWPWPPLLAGLYLAWASASHTRLAAYLNAAGVVLAGLLAKELGWLAPARPWRKVLLGGLAAYGAYLAFAVPRISWERPFNEKHVPAAAAEFMAREREVLGSLRLFNQWEWGGYLSWRLGPGFKVFCDGRYLFHHELPGLAKAAEQAGTWQELMRRRGFQGALLRNIGDSFPTTRRYPDGTTREFLRPWYLFYMPLDRWALVHQDEKALLFVERGAVPERWLREKEYRLLRLGDEAAMTDALRRGELKEGAVLAEAERLRGELAVLGGAAKAALR